VTIAPEDIADHVAKYLAAGGKIYYAKPGESGLTLETGLSLGIKSPSNYKERDANLARRIAYAQNRDR
jgi:hypothetical protein